ncbi:mRNA decay activator protein ZFP36L2-A [Bienertia sinuspersici]
MKNKGYYSSDINSTGGPPKLNLLNDSVSPINSPSESIIMRYLRASDHDSSFSPNNNRSIVNYHKNVSSKSSSSSRSPLSTVKNLEDDVLVMDGILVDSNKVLKCSGKFRSSSSTSDSSSNSASNFYKTEICMSWENTGSCRYGHKCQFAHGKEELRPIANRVRPKLELVDPYYSPQSSTSSNSSKFAVETMITPPAKEAENSKLNKALPIQSKDAPDPYPNLKTTDWSPLDDGITAQSPSSTHETPPRKTLNDYIDNLLYGSAEKKRLPVFVDICPN